MRWIVAGELGKIRHRTLRGGDTSFYLDFRPNGRVWSIPDPGGCGAIRIRDEVTAARLLESIRAAVAAGRSLDQALAPYLARSAPENMITARVSHWLKHRRAHCKAGDISPTYLRELERYARADGYIPWWKGVSIFEVTYGGLEDWSQSLADQGLSGSTRRKVLGAFRTFLTWLRRRGDIDEVPEFPSVPVDEYAPTIISANAQEAILAQIPFDRRGAILAAVRLGIRPGEIRALDVDDYQEGWIMLSKAKKGPNDNAPTRGTKNRQCRRLPAPEDLQEWISWRLSRVTPQERLSGPVALFPNPTACNPEKRWIANTLREEWNRAAKAVGIRVKMYEGTKHAFASNAIAAGVDLYRLRDFLGHKDARSTERYARLADVGRLEVLRRTRDLSLACRSGDFRAENPSDDARFWRGGRDSNPYGSWLKCNGIKSLVTEQGPKIRPTSAPRTTRGPMRWIFPHGPLCRSESLVAVIAKTQPVLPIIGTGTATRGQRVDRFNGILDSRKAGSLGA